MQTINPALVIKGWNSKTAATVQLDGKELVEGNGFRQGTYRDTDGTKTMVVWIENESTKPLNIEISKDLKLMYFAS